jgi:cobalt-zinc-cadmium efflux system outer membrane protein
MQMARTGAVLGGLVLASLGAAGAARATEGELFPLADDSVLEALVAEALERNPDLRAVREEAGAARERVAQAGALPDPRVTAGYQEGGGGGLGSDEDTFAALSVSQELPFPGKRRLAEQVADKESARSEQPLLRARISLIERVRRAYTDLLLARENLRLVAEQEEATRGIEAVTRSRYSVGLSEQADVLRAQAELARLVQTKIREEGNEAAALAELNGVLARPSGTAVPDVGRLTRLAGRLLPPPPLAELLARAERSSPEIAAARLATERSRLASDLARRGLKPDFSVRTTYMNRGSLPDMWALELGVTVPAYAGRKQKRAVAESEARLRADEAGVEATSLRVRTGVERSLAELSAAQREAEAYSEGVLSVDRLAAESALANYRAGKVPFIAVLEAHNTQYRDRWTHAELLARVLRHSARVDALLPPE